ncbi:thermonuclease family protein [Ruegeria sp. HKCCD5849]|nr:thermonuclease family protein [Ruegeria sp. HKCCD5849]NOD52285.1 thermonuclease family protein [Ruegeria sp. HKCCD5851]NOD68388.1 thermonuclease family protein [Ruegeria sp. HKCCD7303]
MLRICLAFVLFLPSVALAAQRFMGQIHVIDADTWGVGGVRVRLHGIDAPEIDQSCHDTEGSRWPCGAWVTQVVRQRYQGKTATCVPLDRDRYGRVVAKCTSGGQDAADQLVRQSLAFACLKYSSAYASVERDAKSRKLGLHQQYIQVPWVHRAAGKSRSTVSCRIKGNISAKGDRIFHVPGQNFYAKTEIDMSRGEHWFCSAAEARAAGWRASQR